ARHARPFLRAGCWADWRDGRRSPGKLGSRRVLGPGRRGDRLCQEGDCFAMTPTVTVRLHLWNSSRAQLLSEIERVVRGLVARGFENDEMERIDSVGFSGIRSQVHAVMG